MADEDPLAGFDAVLARLDEAMVVVTAAVGEEHDGCLVGFHSQAGMHPPRYVVWLSVANRTYRLASAATHLAVHSLGAGDHGLAERFGGTTADDGIDKLAGLDWRAGPGGVPLLAELPTRFVGRVVARLEAPEGDHVGFVLEPVRVDEEGGPVERSDRAPLRRHDALDIDAGHPA